MDPDPIDVFVNSDGQPFCVPDELRVRGTRRVKIVWRIDRDAFRAGWRFPDDPEDAIIFKDPSNNQFSDLEPDGSENGRRIKVKDRNSDERDYPYTICLEKNGQRVCVDPSIKNRAGGSFVGNDRTAAAVTAGVIAGAVVAAIVYIALDDD